MNTIFDSILLNSLQMESNSEEAILGCTVYENGEHYATEMVLSATAMNQLLNELVCREIELDFENWNEIKLPDGGSVFHMQLDSPELKPVFLPLYVLPERVRLLRA
ncbi:MAG: hypothetical protein QE487_18100 [Fluviicola sp.]|nr:hypothetical protein [Fluviicola sp.]